MFFDEVGITQQFSATRTPQQNGVVERRNRTLVEVARTLLTFANLPSFLWAEAIAIACFTQNHSIIHKRFDKTPYELINKRKPNIKFFHVFGCRCYLLNDYEDVGKLKAKGYIRVFVGYSKVSGAFRIYNKRTRKIHESVNVNFDELSEMASKQFSLEPGLSNLNEMGKPLNLSVSQIMKSSTTNVETPINKEVYHEVFESFQGESYSSSLNDDVQQSPEEVILPSSNTQLIPINMVPNGDEASTSHNMLNERLEDAYFDASTLFHDPSNVQTFYQPYPHEKKWTKDHPLHKRIGDSKSSVRTRGQLANLCLFSCLLSSIEPANVDEALKNADWVSAMQEELDQFARLKVWRLVPRPDGKSVIKSKWIFKNKKDESSLVIRNKGRLVAVDVKTAFLHRILKEEVYVGQPPVPTPMVEQEKLKLDLVRKPVDHTDYRSMIGSLMYVTSSRPDIMFATCMCARYQANPNEHHVSAIKRIFHYLKGTINLGLWYLKDSGFDLTAYSDADLARCHLDRKIESEYVAVSGCCAQVLWMRTQLTDYGFFYEKVPIYCDSKSAIAISCNPVQHTQTKHIDVRPDIMFATCMCARYQANPNEYYVSAIKRIFRYLKGTIDLGLWYPKDSGFDLTAYSDADHAGCHLDRK
nr:hypothetical protein [Tanacetum cinerariifolium]